MSYGHAKYSPVGSNYVWKSFINEIFSALQFFKAGDVDSNTARAIKDLSKCTEYELNDMGLSRSDLTPDGLACAGARRSYHQAKIDREITRAVN